MATQTIEIEGRRYVVIPEDEYLSRLPAVGGTKLPEPPRPLPNGNYDALSSLRISLARKIIMARNAAGLSQVDLARAAGIRIETLNRIEKAKVTPDQKTVDKIARALKKKGQTV